MLDPQAREYGDAVKTDTGMVQVTAVDEVISQFEACCEKERSFYLNDTL
jgi:hypothetical protein